MKFVFYSLLACLALFNAGCAHQAHQAGTTHTHKGNIVAYAYDDYAINLAKDDTLSVNIDTDKLDVIIYSPIELALENNKPVRVQSAGEYTLRVLMPRAFARRGEAYDYTLTIHHQPTRK